MLNQQTHTQSAKAAACLLFSQPSVLLLLLLHERLIFDKKEARTLVG